MFVINCMLELTGNWEYDLAKKQIQSPGWSCHLDYKILTAHHFLIYGDWCENKDRKLILYKFVLSRNFT